MCGCNKLLGVGGITHFFFHVEEKRVSSALSPRPWPRIGFKHTGGGFHICVWKFFLPDCDPHACGIIVRHCCCCCCNFWLQGWLANTRRRPTEPRKHMYTSRFWFIIMQTASKICKKTTFFSFVRDGWATLQDLKRIFKYWIWFSMCHGTTAPTVGLTK